MGSKAEAIKLFNAGNPKTVGSDLAAYLKKTPLEGQYYDSEDGGIGEFLFDARPFINTNKLVDFLLGTRGKPKKSEIVDPQFELEEKLRQKFLSQFNFAGKDILTALRTVIATMPTGGEGQKVSRWCYSFAKAYCLQHQEFNPEQVETLALSIIMLDTVFTKPNAGFKITEEIFSSSDMASSCGSSKEALKKLYKDIHEFPLESTFIQLEFSKELEEQEYTHNLQEKGLIGIDEDFVKKRFEESLIYPQSEDFKNLLSQKEIITDGKFNKDLDNLNAIAVKLQEKGIDLSPQDPNYKKFQEMIFLYEGLAILGDLQKNPDKSFPIKAGDDWPITQQLLQKLHLAELWLKLEKLSQLATDSFKDLKTSTFLLEELRNRYPESSLLKIAKTDFDLIAIDQGRYGIDAKSRKEQTEVSYGITTIKKITALNPTDPCFNSALLISIHFGIENIHGQYNNMLSSVLDGNLAHASVIINPLMETFKSIPDFIGKAGNKLNKAGVNPDLSLLQDFAKHFADEIDNSSDYLKTSGINFIENSDTIKTSLSSCLVESGSRFSFFVDKTGKINYKTDEGLTLKEELHLRTDLVKKELLDFNNSMGKHLDLNPAVVAKYTVLKLIQLLLSPPCLIYVTLSKKTTLKSYLKALLDFLPYKKTDTSSIEKLFDEVGDSKLIDQVNSALENESKNPKIAEIVDPLITRCKELLTNFTKAPGVIIEPAKEMDLEKSSSPHP
ncbi:MAG: hypothetical protein KKE11_01360 [Gammaproteobacteria bacterium]|nr:hypothetical protein [Gammaproteobacteria bacterium]